MEPLKQLAQENKEEVREKQILHIVFAFPLSPETLNLQLQAVAEKLLKGPLMSPNYRVPVLVKAGKEVHIPFYLPKDWICTKRTPLSFQSNYYSTDITVQVFVDDTPITPYPMPLDHPFEVDFGVYYVKKKGVYIILKNNTSTDATITFQVVPNLMTKMLYESWYRPLMEYSWELTSKLANEYLRARKI